MCVCGVYIHIYGHTHYLYIGGLSKVLLFDRPVIETCVRVCVCVFVCILKVVGPRFLLLGRPVVETSAFCQLRCYVFRWRKIKGLQGTINYHIMGGNQNTYLISNTYMILFFFVFFIARTSSSDFLGSFVCSSFYILFLLHFSGLHSGQGTGYCEQEDLNALWALSERLSGFTYTRRSA